MVVTCDTGQVANVTEGPGHARQSASVRFAEHIEREFDFGAKIAARQHFGEVPIHNSDPTIDSILKLLTLLSRFDSPEVGIGATATVVLLLVVRVRNHGGIGREVAGRVGRQEVRST